MVLYKVTAQHGKYFLNSMWQDVVHVQDGVTYMFDIFRHSKSPVLLVPHNRWRAFRWNSLQGGAYDKDAHAQSDGQNTETIVLLLRLSRRHGW